MPQNKQDRIQSISDILQGAIGDLAGLFGQMEWAEDEIARGVRRHPADADTLYHSFSLLTPSHELMATEFVYRGHCRELLVERVVVGADTRPGTAAEICCVSCEASQAVPLTSPAAGLYLRMWAAAFPDKQMFVESQQAHEVLERSTIDDIEATMRRKLAVKDRTLGIIDCAGLHHGTTVQCKYHTAAKAA
jgi:hypothetical protein